MAQTDSLTNAGMAEMCKLLAGEAATCIKSMVCLKTACTASTAQTDTSLTKCTEAGLVIGNCTAVASVKTTFTDDTIQADKIFTAGASATVKGCALYNDDDTDPFAVTCFAGDVSVESSDTITQQFKIVLQTT